MTEAAVALNRFGLGGTAGQAAPARPRAWLIEQFARYAPRPAPIAALPATTEIATDIADYLAELRGLRREMRASGGAADAPAMADPATPGALRAERPEALRAVQQFGRRQRREFYAGAAHARMVAAVASESPFVERLVHFWANHFAVSADKQVVVGLAGQLEFDAIRPHVLGKFADMLNAVERHPAMLLYLDQAQSIGPDSPLGSRIRARANRPVGLNENLAREILELHTLGVDGGYDQGDVTEFARALTGWTVAGLARGAAAARFLRQAGPPGSFQYVDTIHQPGDRTILGRRYAAGGEGQAAAVLRDLATHPRTARHIATKLARHFCADDPPPALVARLERAFLESGGDLPSVYRALVEAPEPWAPSATKFRTPWDWSVAAARAVGGPPPANPLATANLLNQLGQPIWRPGSPAGFDDVAASWAGPDALMRRVEAAQAFAARMRGEGDARALAAALFPGSLSASTGSAIARAESPAQAIALLLVSPEFLRR
ncbi:DUF1800 domain-containing protein [Sphingomonas sp. SFZ2018-12]|uniref:DUF1800 domain-containing protein n=1 Tax=Sphingomonas sp. SFZ2018-12 TaxID=2683197 RepID=UPI001F0CF653